MIEFLHVGNPITCKAFDVSVRAADGGGGFVLTVVGGAPRSDHVDVLADRTDPDGSESSGHNNPAISQARHRLQRSGLPHILDVVQLVDD